ncbi:MAG: hypothetical protein WCL70_07870 [Paludibacter sp.]
MSKIKISEDQDTVIIDDVEYKFIPYTAEIFGICGIKTERCVFIDNIVCMSLPCTEHLRNDNKQGYFKLKTN